MFTGLMFARMRQEAALKNLVTSLSLQFSLLKLLSDKIISWLFVATDSKRMRISRITRIIDRLANEKLTHSGIYSYSGISQSERALNVLPEKLTIYCCFTALKWRKKVSWKYCLFDFWSWVRPSPYWRMQARLIYMDLRSRKTFSYLKNVLSLWIFFFHRTWFLSKSFVRIILSPVWKNVGITWGWDNIGLNVG